MSTSFIDAMVEHLLDSTSMLALRKLCWSSALHRRWCEDNLGDLDAIAMRIRGNILDEMDSGGSLAGAYAESLLDEMEGESAIEAYESLIHMWNALRRSEGVSPDTLVELIATLPAPTLRRLLSYERYILSRTMMLADITEEEASMPMLMLIVANLSYTHRATPEDVPHDRYERDIKRRLARYFLLNLDAERRYAVTHPVLMIHRSTGTLPSWWTQALRQ